MTTNSTSCCGETKNQSVSAAEPGHACCCGTTDKASQSTPVTAACCQTTPEVKYHRETFVSGELPTAIGPVKLTNSRLSLADRYETILVRCGIGRNSYAIKPGLYGIGDPNQESPVLVTANYKLSFDHLRRALTGVNAWILVLDSKGINVWCAAGKKTFGTEELLLKIKETRLAELVTHRKLIIPQLGATGVAAHLVKQRSGFKVVWGPIRASDLQTFLANDMKADPAMKQVTFSFVDRLVLTPVEIRLLLKPAVLIFLLLTLLSGIGPDGFSFANAWNRGQNLILLGVIGILSGTVLAPALLPWLPFRSFYLKGMMMGLISSTACLSLVKAPDTGLETIALICAGSALSSYLTMNFTGSTPFTSPSGVEKEMRRGIPLQAIGGTGALVLWIITPFI